MARVTKALPYLLGAAVALVVTAGRKKEITVKPTTTPSKKPGLPSPTPIPAPSPGDLPGVSEFDQCKFVIERHDSSGNVLDQKIVFDGSAVEFQDMGGIGEAMTMANAAEQERQAQQQAAGAPPTPGKWILTRTCEVISPDGIIDTVRITVQTLLSVSP